MTNITNIRVSKGMVVTPQRNIPKNAKVPDGCGVVLVTYMISLLLSPDSREH